MCRRLSTPPADPDRAVLRFADLTSKNTRVGPVSAVVPAPTMITDRMTVRIHRLILFCYTSISKIVQ